MTAAHLASRAVYPRIPRRVKPGGSLRAGQGPAMRPRTRGGVVFRAGQALIVGIPFSVLAPAAPAQRTPKWQRPYDGATRDERPLLVQAHPPSP